MTEATTAGSLRTELHIDQAAGRRDVSRTVGRLVVDEHELAVRSALTQWIPARSVSRDAVGEISVVRRIEIRLPILRGRQVEVVTFDPTQPVC